MTLVEAALNAEGYAILPGLLPADLQQLRESLYRGLSPLANQWAEILGKPQRFPAELRDYLVHETVLRAGDFEPLHDHAGGDHVFPFQLVGLLGEPSKDFTGGDFVMVEQRPRMQSRPIVVPLRRGDVAVIATSERPHKGSKGYYRVRMRHAIGRVITGERHGVEILFHNTLGHEFNRKARSAAALAPT